MAKKEQALEVRGTVLSAEGGDKFLISVEMNGEHVVKGYISGKMRKNYIRIVPGDIVKVELSPYDLTQGRITFREK